MYELEFVIIAISIGLFIKYAFIQESQRPYPYHQAFDGFLEELLNWGRVNPKAGVFVNLMIIELHVYYIVMPLFILSFGVLQIIYIGYLGMFGVWVILISLLNIVEAKSGLSWKSRTQNIAYSDRREKEVKEIFI